LFWQIHSHNCRDFVKLLAVGQDLVCCRREGEKLLEIGSNTRAEDQKLDRCQKRISWLEEKVSWLEKINKQAGNQKISWLEIKISWLEKKSKLAGKKK